MFSPLENPKLINLTFYHTLSYAVLCSYELYHLKEIQKEKHRKFYFISTVLSSRLNINLLILLFINQESFIIYTLYPCCYDRPLQ